MGGGGATIGSTASGDSQYAMAKTSVWWDIENCHVPKGWDPHSIAQNISSALVDMDYRGPVSISAYGDTNKLTAHVQHALSGTGIALNHVPAGVKDASDKKILVDMLFWAVDNPPPANYLLISGDRDFSNALHQLRMRRYNILLAQPQNVSAPLVAAAKSVWKWTNLLAGGPPESADSSQPVNTANAEMSKNVFPDPLQVKQPVDPDFGNHKPYGNGKVDNKIKLKQPRRNPTQSNISRTSSNEFRQPSAGLQGGPSNGSFDKSNQKWKNATQQQNQVPTSKSSSIQSLESAHSNYTGVSSSFFHQSSSNISTESNFPLPPTSSGFPQQPGYAQGKQFKEVPHEFFGDNKPKASSAPPSFSARGPDPSWNNGNHFPNNYPFQYPQPLRPNDLLPLQPTFTPGNSFPRNSHLHGSHPLPPRSDGPPFTSGPPTSIPDIGKLNITDYPSSVHNNSTFQRNTEPWPGVVFESSNPGNYNVPHAAHPAHNAPPFYPGASNNGHHHGPEFRPPTSLPMDINDSNNGFWGTPGCPQPSSHVQGLIGSVLLALNTLKNDKMVPTEANIADCIHYGDMNLPNFNVKMAIDSAIEQQMIVKHSVGGALQIYIQKNDTLWKCVNPLGANVKHPKTTWDAIQKFLSSAGGRSAMMAAQCRYQAAAILKKSCLKDLVLGDILQILHLIINCKKWIVTHPSGWQPISITLTEVNGKAGARTAT